MIRFFVLVFLAVSTKALANPGPYSPHEMEASTLATEAEAIRNASALDAPDPIQVPDLDVAAVWAIDELDQLIVMVNDSNLPSTTKMQLKLSLVITKTGATSGLHNLNAAVTNFADAHSRAKSALQHFDNVLTPPASVTELVAGKEELTKARASFEKAKKSFSLAQARIEYAVTSVPMLKSQVYFEIQQNLPQPMPIMPGME